MNSDKTPVSNTTESPIPPSRDRRYHLYGEEEKKTYVEKVSRKLTPTFDFILFSIITFGLLVGAYFTDEPAFFILGILFAPLLTPLLAISFGFSFGKIKYFTTSLFGLLLSILAPFLAGYSAGLLQNQFLEVDKDYWQIFIHFSWFTILLLVIGASLTTFIFVRNPRLNALVSNVALVYGLFLTLGSAGFALSQGNDVLFYEGLKLFGLYFLVVITTGSVTLFFLRLHIRKFLRLIPFMMLIGFTGFYLFSFSTESFISPFFAANSWLPEMGKMSNPLPIDTVVVTPTKEKIVQESTQRLPTGLQKTEAVPTLNQATSTPTLPPTYTPTTTLTPLPTPVWAEVNAVGANGANIRTDPGFSARILTTLLNGTLIQVLPDTASVDGIIWVKVKLQDQTEGWIVRNLILSATPAPGW